MAEGKISVLKAQTDAQAASLCQTETPFLPFMVQDVLKCKNCFEVKANQKQLPCQHTVCLPCLEKLTIVNQKYTCPISECGIEGEVPRGGLKNLPESLFIKQLINMVVLSHQPDMMLHKDFSDTRGSVRKVKLEIEKRKLTLREKIENYKQERTGIERNSELMIQRINKMAKKKISVLESQRDAKTEAIKNATLSKTNHINEQLKKLQDAENQVNTKIKHLAKLLEKSAKDDGKKLEDDEAEPIDDDELLKARTSLQDLNTLISFSDTPSNKFREGDSVRLKMDVDLLEPKFLDKKFNHESVGYAIAVTEELDKCAAIFPENSTFVGNVSMLEKSTVKHNLPVIGDRVKVKVKEGKEPHDGWGSVNSESIGILTIICPGISDGQRDIKVDFPEDHDWDGVYDELVKAEPETIEEGDEVWLARGLSLPVEGWHGVTPTSIGKVLSIDGDNVEVEFEGENSKGPVSKVEKVRPIIVGDTVRVKKSVEKPTVMPRKDDNDNMEGVVKKILETKKHETVAKIKCKNNDEENWSCLVTELEVVHRVSNVTNMDSLRLLQEEQCTTQ